MEGYGETSYASQRCTALVLDGSAVVHMVEPRLTRTFGDYCKQEITTFIKKVKTQEVARVDIVFDVYNLPSIKGECRKKREKGGRIKITEGTPLPKNWKSFLCVSGNKTDLFALIANKISDEDGIVCTLNENVLPSDRSSLDPCNHEEVDTRIFIHLLDLVKESHASITIVIVDTDVVITAISKFSYLSKLGLEPLWIEYGTGKHKK